MGFPLKAYSLILADRGTAHEVVLTLVDILLNSFYYTFRFGFW